MKKKIILTLTDKDSEMWESKTTKELVLENLPIGKPTVCSLVAQSLEKHPRRVMDILKELTEEGILDMRNGKIETKNGRTMAHIFTRIK
jgi:Mn-dependent DtxR family transcriptional regulator